MNMFLRFIFVLILFSSIGFSQSERPEIHCKHFLFGYPWGADSSNDMIIRDIYALSNNDSTKFADWVCYRLTKDNLGDAETNRNWNPDPWLSDAETLEPTDYKGAYNALSTDRGHLAPLASFKGTEYWYETNYLSNITPQKSKMNRGVWKNLEEATRNLLDTFQFVFVMTGTLYEREMPTLPGADEEHQIPSGFWKIVTTVLPTGSIRVAAYIIDQNTTNSDFNNYLVTVDEIEERSGFDFFWELDNKIEDSIERIIEKEWIEAHLK